ncbi:MAG: DivIVA domain-containing protein [Clostridiales bacterium]|jgi:cell division initiation protein|nr:DivIVA domain-containing protein [Clostridiales bacterium]
MLTPQEIKDKSFSKVMVGGYELNAVDSFRETVYNDYSQLYKENITLKGKLKMLVDRIEEYRSVDDQMRKALLNAQTVSAKMVEDAKKDVENRERMASERMDEKLREIRAKVEAEEARLREAKNRANAYIDYLSEVYQKEIDQLEILRAGETIPDRAFAPVAPVIETPEETEEEVVPDTVPLPELPQIDVSDEDLELPKIPVREEEPELKIKTPFYKTVIEDDEETINLTPKPKFEFSNLQFGENYDPSQKSKK